MCVEVCFFPNNYAFALQSHDPTGKWFSAFTILPTPLFFACSFCGGGDGLQPFLKDASRGVWVLCKTSNPGATCERNMGIMAV